MCAGDFRRYSVDMDMEQVIRQLQDTAKLMAFIPARPADMLKGHDGGLKRRRRFSANQTMARNARLMAEMQRMLDSLNRKPD